MNPSQYRFARNLLFRLDAETAHHVSMGALRKLETIQLLRLLNGNIPKAEPVHGSSIPQQSWSRGRT
jgi:dihydroorotate dehydrogenase